MSPFPKKLVLREKMRGAARIRTGDGGFAIRCLSHLATAPNPGNLGNPLVPVKRNRKTGKTKQGCPGIEIARPTDRLLLRGWRFLR